MWLVCWIHHHANLKSQPSCPISHSFTLVLLPFHSPKSHPSSPNPPPLLLIYINKSQVFQVILRLIVMSLELLWGDDFILLMSQLDKLVNNLGYSSISLMVNCVTDVLFICNPPSPTFSQTHPSPPSFFPFGPSPTHLLPSCHPLSFRTHPLLLPPFLIVVGAEMIRTQFALTTKSLFIEFLL